MALRDRIAEAIEGSGKTRADVARACKVTNAAVTHWISGSTLSLRAETALALEEVTGYRAQWILTGRGTKKLGESFWPFSVPVERFQALSEKQKGYVDARLEQIIEHCEQPVEHERFAPPPARPLPTSIPLTRPRNQNTPPLTERKTRSSR